MHPSTSHFQKMFLMQGLHNFSLILNLFDSNKLSALALERREKMYTYNGGGVEIDTNFFIFNLTLELSTKY